MKSSVKANRRWIGVLLCMACFVVSLAGCSAGSKAPSAIVGTEGTQQVFQVKGVLKEIKDGGKTAVIRHEEVTNYMPAMTMPFDVKNPKEVASFKPGDALSFRLTVTEKDSWIDQLHAVNNTTNATAPKPGTGTAIKVMRPAEPLEIGSALPDYTFTNELGQPVSFSQFKGQPLAITFIFTRCPLPNFCPRMTSNFAEAQQKLLSRAGGPTNWHLLTISFDPEFDTPAVMKSHAERLGADPHRWIFLTGDLAEITAFSQQVGQTFWKEEGAINHNLRTLVIDPSGRLQKIFTGNNWTSDELVQELTKSSGTAAK